jgi:hypothetical protein
LKPSTIIFTLPNNVSKRLDRPQTRKYEGREPEITLKTSYEFKNLFVDYLFIVVPLFALVLGVKYELYSSKEFVIGLALYVFIYLSSSCFRIKIITQKQI